MKNTFPLASIAGLTLLLSGISHAQPLRLPVQTSIPIPQFLEHALEGRLAEFQAALAAGMSPSQADETGRTPLMMASFNGHTPIAKLLLEKGAEVDTRDGINRTALMYASTGPHSDTVALLLDKGAEVNAVDSHEKFTPLMFAAAEGHREVVELLLKHGADPRMKDTDGDTAGSFAAQRGHQTLVKDLQAAAEAYAADPKNQNN